MDPSENALLERIRAGDITAFEELFNTYYLILNLYAKKIIGDPIEAQDIVQNVFVKLYANRKSLNINTSVRSYLYRAVHNACLNHLRQNKIHQGHHEHIRLQVSPIEDADTLITAEFEAKVWNAIQALPDQCRKIFVLNRFEGKKNSEIAELLGISQRTVETQISKALKKLRENLPGTLTALMLISQVH